MASSSTRKFHRKKFDSARIKPTYEPHNEEIVLMDQELIVPIYTLDTGRIEVSAATVPNPRSKDEEPSLKQKIADSLVTIPGIGQLIKHQNLQTNPYDSGDYFEVIDYNKHNVGLLIADSSKTGKPGIKHAEGICEELKKTIRGIDKHGVRKMPPSFDQSFEIVAKKYAHYAQQNPDESRYFCSVLYVDIMRGPNGTAAMTMISAGHFFPIFYSPNKRSNTNGYSYPGQAGPAVGLVIDQPKFPKSTSLIKEGEYAVLYSDGIVEAKGKEGEIQRQGLVNLIDNIIQQGARDTREIVKIALEEVNDFRDTKVRSDDMTLMVAKIKE